MRTSPLFSGFLGAFIALSTAVPYLARAQDTGNRSDYVFSYAPSPSALFLESMTFPEEQPLQLDELNCSTTLKINGPLTCAERCEFPPLCLLTFTGPSGLETGDLLSKEAETPANGASPTPSGAPSRLSELKPIFNSH